jgi:hypothetical protein
VVFTVVHAEQSHSELFNAVNSFLKKRVHNNLVAYKAIKNNPKQINELVASFEKFDLRSLPDTNSEKAFWINAYNILVISAVVTDYPIDSPMDVAGFFDKKKHLVAGEELTLNGIENMKIRKKFDDPRIHFALVCAAVSCPPLINEAYFAEKLDKQLDERTKANLNDDLFIRFDKETKTVHLSEIFKWYKDDFVTDGKTLLQFVNQNRLQKIPEDVSIDYYTYDWRLNEYKENKTGQAIFETGNLQAYTPSTLLSPGETEIKIFNNLYTQTAFFDSDANKVDLNARSTYFTNISSFLVGVKPNINIGFDVYFKSVRNGGESSSPLSVFQFSSGNNTRTALTSFAPKIKLSPFSKLRNFSIQTLLLIPLASDADETPFLDYDDVQWWTQFFYDKMLTNTLLVYLENGWFLRFGNDETAITSPTKAILNYYPSNKWTVYLPTEFTPKWDNASWSAYYFQAGVGLKYQLTTNLELETLFTKFFEGKQQGAGVTYNLGVRIIR